MYKIVRNTKQTQVTKDGKLIDQEDAIPVDSVGIATPNKAGLVMPKLMGTGDKFVKVDEAGVLSYDDTVYVLEKASPHALGGVKVQEADYTYTMPVGIDSEGFLKIQEPTTEPQRPSGETFPASYVISVCDTVHNIINNAEPKTLEGMEVKVNVYNYHDMKYIELEKVSIPNNEDLWGVALTIYDNLSEDYTRILLESFKKGDWGNEYHPIREELNKGRVHIMGGEYAPAILTFETRIESIHNKYHAKLWEYEERKVKDTFGENSELYKVFYNTPGDSLWVTISELDKGVNGIVVDVQEGI